MICATAGLPVGFSVTERKIERWSRYPGVTRKYSVKYKSAPP